MYAAAGGASLASRQARNRQRQNKKQQQLRNNKEIKPHQAKQYHNYTDDQAGPKLSRIERGALRLPNTSQERRHSYHLKEPLKTRLRESPSISIPVQSHPPPPSTLSKSHILSSPTLQLPQILVPVDDGTLERRCSFVRQVEEMEKCQEGGLLDRCNHLCNFEIKDHAWEEHCADYEPDEFGSLECPFSEGRAAWQEKEKGRRCSLAEDVRLHRGKQIDAHHRWMKGNRIHDSTYSPGSDGENFINEYHQSAAANALLYVGLGTTVIGSVIFFVGTGEKGFKTIELRLIGPTLVVCGLLCCLIRVLLCACPFTYLRRNKKRLSKKALSHAYIREPKVYDGGDHHVDSAALLSNNKKKVSIVPPIHPIPSTSMYHLKDTLPMQCNKENVPQIYLPEYTENANFFKDSIIELQSLELVYDDIESVSSNNSEHNRANSTENKSVSKLARTREPANITQANVKTSLSVVVERSDNSESSEKERKTHSGVVLSPLQLEQ